MEDKGEKLAFKARHKDSHNSMAVGIDLVKNGEADAFVTAGNTGAGMITALFRLGRLRGVDLPTFESLEKLRFRMDPETRQAVLTLAGEA